MTKPHAVNEPVPAYTTNGRDVQADFKGAQVAIRRAAQRARQVAQQTGTDLIVARGGQIVRLPPSRDGSEQ